MKIEILSIIITCFFASLGISFISEKIPYGSDPAGNAMAAGLLFLAGIVGAAIFALVISSIGKLFLK